MSTQLAPYSPIAAELEDKKLSGRPWGDEAYVAIQLREAGFERVETEVLKERARVGNPKLLMETMQFPLMFVKAFWPEDKQAEYLKELNEIMSKWVVQMVGGEDGVVEVDFEGIVAWGWKGD